MSGMIDPKPPSSGWERRWLIESAHLIFLTPLAAVMAGGGIVASGLATISISGMSAGLDAFLSFFVSLYVALFFVTTSIRVMGKSEGYLPRIFRLRPYSALTQSSFLFFFVISAYVGFVTGQQDLLSNPSLDGAAVTNSAPESLALYLIAGSEKFIAVVLFASMIGFLTIPCFAMLDVSFRQGMLILMRALVTCRDVMKKGLIFMIPFMIIADMLPFYVTAPAAVFMVFWIYVAGREIFGGITGNRVPDTALKQSHA